MATDPVKKRMMTDKTGQDIVRELARMTGGSAVADAEAWAVGQRNGEDVPPTDPTYHNNSKYHSQQSASSATDANNAKVAAVAAKDAAEAATVHQPRVNTTTNNWEVWDSSASEYVDTGVSARGVSEYVHFKWSEEEPTQDSDMKDSPDAWIGIYSGTSATAPTTYTSYTWYLYKGATGATPNLSVGTVTTGDAGTQASVTQTGTQEAPVLNFTIPRGAKGDPGNADLIAANYADLTYPVDIGKHCIYDGHYYRAIAYMETADAQFTAAHWEDMGCIGDEIESIGDDLYLKYVSPFNNTHAGLSNDVKTIVVKQNTDFENNPYIFFGKNYFPKPEYFVGNNSRNSGLQISAYENIVHVKGTATSGNAFYIMNPETNNQYFPFPSDINVGDKLNLYVFAKRNVTQRCPNVRFYITDSNKSNLANSSYRIAADGIYGKGGTITVPSGAAYFYIMYQYNSGDVHDNYIMAAVVKDTTVIDDTLTFSEGYATLESSNETTELTCLPHQCVVKNDVEIKKYIDYNDIHPEDHDNRVTPEMFGAWGDGTHDDSDAIQKCIDYAREKQVSVYGSGSYRTGSTVVISGSYNTVVLNRIVYYGNECAVVTKGMYNSVHVRFLYTPNGTGFRLISDTECSYNDIHLGRVHSAKRALEMIKGEYYMCCNCIYFNHLETYKPYSCIYQSSYYEDPNHSTFMNTNNFIGGRLSTGKWGVENAHPADTYITCMFENLDGCVLMERGEIKIIAPRFAEEQGSSHDRDEHGYLYPDKGIIVKTHAPVDENGYGVGSRPGYGFFMHPPQEHMVTSSINLTDVPWQRIDSQGNIINYYKNNPPPTLVTSPLVGRMTEPIAPWFMVWGKHILIKEPYANLEFHITASEHGYLEDFRSLTTDRYEFYIYSRFIVDDEGCDYSLPPSYDYIAFNKFVFEQHDGSYCTFRDWRQTAVINGQALGDGVFEVSIVNVDGRGGDYTNNNQAFMVRRVINGDFDEVIGNTPMGTTATTLTGAVKELNDHITKQTIPISGVTSAHTINTNQSSLSKITKIVCARLSITLTSNVSSFEAVASLPDSAKPAIQYIGFGFDSSYNPVPFDITTSGNIRVWKAMTSGENFDISAEYFTA